jgi:hypothetical protein
MELISPKLIIAKDVENLIPIADNLQQIKVLKQLLPTFIEKDKKIHTTNLQLYITLLGAYRKNEDFNEASEIAQTIYEESKRAGNKGFTIQSNYMMVCSLLDDGKIFEAKTVLNELKSLKSKTFSYLYSCASAKYYGISNNNTEEINSYKTALNLAIKAKALDRVTFEILCGLALAYEKDMQYNRALLIYKELNKNKYNSTHFLTNEQQISINFRIARIYGYLKNDNTRNELLKTLVSNSECLNNNHPLRRLINKEYASI